jgi:AcrR family transcriptional regulator
MIEGKLDRRTERTRQALVQGFVWLVHHGHPIEDIRISDIIERANVGRSTFYEHFKNKDEILAFSFQPLFHVLSGMIDEKRDISRLAEMMQFNWEHRNIGRSLFGDSRRVMVRVLAKAIEARLRRCKTPAANRIPSRVAAIALAEAQIGALNAWVWGEMTCTPTEMAETLLHLARSCVAAKLI